MRLISHRGNINGRVIEDENNPIHIDYIIALGYEIEIDVWMIQNTLLLGHNEPQYTVTQNWLYERIDSMWIHCKNIQALEWFNIIDEFNYFWHETDAATLTSHGWIWAFPGKQPIEKSIAVLPEIYNDDISKCIGICSDFIKNYKGQN